MSDSSSKRHSSGNHGQAKLTREEQTVSSIVRNKIVALSFSQYAVGNLALGYVLQVATTHLVVSLPGGLIGTVAVNEISDIAPSLESNEEVESNVSLIDISNSLSSIIIVFYYIFTCM